MKFGRCARCRHGITAMDREKSYTICAALPPFPIELDVQDPRTPGKSNTVRSLTWQRPQMMNAGWCGQFKIGWLRLLGYGPRA